MVIQKSKLVKGLPKDTTSLCPECKKIIKAKIFAENGKVMIEKECTKHGKFKDVYWSDVDMFLKAEQFAYDGIGVENPKYTGATKCPFQCGLCDLHLSHTALSNIDLTNRCNLKCPICFANAAASGYVYEPTFEQIVDMMKMLRANRPVPTPAVQFSGGEPTIRKDFIEIVKKAKELGFTQIQVATNGIKLAQSLDFAKVLNKYGINTVYLQFDGLNEESYIAARGKPLLQTKLKAIENCRNSGDMPLGIILVPTIINTVNDDQVGEILKFAIENNDVIRGVNYQPVAFTGRIPQEERDKQRFTLTDLADRLEKQTDFLKKEDFYSVPCVTPISQLTSILDKQQKVAFTVHPHCGIATFVISDDETGKVIPISRMIDVEGFLGEVKKIAESTKDSIFAKQKAIVKSIKLLKYIKKENVPKDFKLKQLLENVLTQKDKQALADFHWKVTFVGGMHFQDLYNYDIERVKRCCIHYTTPDGRLIPFCAYNGGPTFREQVEKKFSIPMDEWRRRNHDSN